MTRLQTTKSAVLAYATVVIIVSRDSPQLGRAANAVNEPVMAVGEGYLDGMAQSDVSIHNAEVSASWIADLARRKGSLSSNRQRPCGP